MHPYPPLHPLYAHEAIHASLLTAILFTTAAWFWPGRIHAIARRRLPLVVVANAVLMFFQWHWYPSYPQRQYEIVLNEAFFWGPIYIWPILLLQTLWTKWKNPDEQTRLVEVWVAVVLLLLLFTSGHVHPRSAAQQSQCMSQLKSIGIAHHNDIETRSGPFLANRGGDDGEPFRSWRVDLLPYLEHAALRRRYDDSANWDAPANHPLTMVRSTPFQCPANLFSTDTLGRTYSSYLACVGPQAFFPASDGARELNDVPDGLGETAMIVEACGQNVVWTEPRDLDVAAYLPGINLPGKQPGRSDGPLSACHPFGTNLLMGDSSVRSLDRNTAPEVIEALLTVDGNEKPFFE